MHSFDPFGTAPADQAAFFIGLVLRPLLAQAPGNYSEDRFPVGPLDLYVDAVQVFDTDPSGKVLSGPLAHDCPAPGTDDTPSGAIEWQVFTGAPEQGDKFDQPKSQGGWTELNVSHDSTLGLSRSARAARGVLVELRAAEATRDFCRAARRAARSRSRSHRGPQGGRLEENGPRR